MPAERGLTWTPKKRGNKFNQFASISNFNSFSEVAIVQDFSSFSQETVVVINQFQGNSFSQQQLQQEQELVVLIQEQMFLLQSQNFIVDNIRKNHFNSRNNNVVCHLSLAPSSKLISGRTLLSSLSNKSTTTEEAIPTRDTSPARSKVTPTAKSKL
jgi:hypothetical protein